MWSPTNHWASRKFTHLYCSLHATPLPRSNPCCEIQGRTYQPNRVEDYSNKVLLFVSSPQSASLLTRPLCHSMTWRTSSCRGTLPSTSLDTYSHCMQCTMSFVEVSVIYLCSSAVSMLSYCSCLTLPLLPTPTIPLSHPSPSTPAPSPHTTSSTYRIPHCNRCHGHFHAVCLCARHLVLCLHRTRLWQICQS